VIGLYLHIPFCASICSYCNFNRGLMDAGLARRYVEALDRDIRAAAAGKPAADTIFFGGGTPSLLDPADIGRLIRACRETLDLAADAEITLETNPETASPDRLVGFREAGVTRISFGIQSFDDAELAPLGRTHTAARAAAAVREARAAGFRNLSIDLMFWLPGQTRDSWRRTLERAVALDPDHLSLYLLELYPNAPLKEAMARQAAGGLDWRQAADDEAADMYLEALDRLQNAGLWQYEISNVARPGFRSRHNVKYWQGGEWIGAGCGAHSTFGGRRWRNVAAAGDYCDRIERGAPVAIDVITLDPQARVEEALFTGLRLAEGIDEGNFLQRFGVNPWSRYERELAPYLDDGLVWRREGRFGLSRRGMLVANDILTTFV
jgi:oxygen-independent coproporphyrinogen-3 oxidase